MKKNWNGTNFFIGSVIVNSIAIIATAYGLTELPKDERRAYVIQMLLLIIPLLSLSVILSQRKLRIKVLKAILTALKVFFKQFLGSDDKDDKEV